MSNLDKAHFERRLLRRRQSVPDGTSHDLRERFLAEELESRLLLSATAKMVGITTPAARPVRPVYHQPVARHPRGHSGGLHADSGYTSPSGLGYAPPQMTGAYGMTGLTFGGTAGTGAGQTIAILDPGDDTALVNSTSSSFSTSDLAIFDKQFGLPDPPSFIKEGFTDTANPTLTTTLPAANTTSSGYDVETSLDVEWAHAMAPQANILLVEGANNFGDIFNGVLAVDAAASSMKIGVLSMSFGGPENATGYFSSTAGEEAFDSKYFDMPGMVYCAATGDYGAYGYKSATIAPQHAATSNDVLAVGGTTLTVGSGNTWGGETTWGNGASSRHSGTGSGYYGGGGGGISLYEPLPAYQTGKVSTYSTTHRTYPDISMDANSPVPIYDSPDFGTGSGWYAVGGTSLACPMIAGLIAIADQGRTIRGLGRLNSSGGSGVTPSNLNGNASVSDVHTILYGLSSSNYHDITSGTSTGPTPTYSPAVGYDLTTGIGSPVGNLLASNLGYNDGPSVGGLSASPSPATFGGTISLSAATVADVGVGTTVSSVAFYRDPLGQTGTTGGTVVGTATTGSSGTWTLANVSTTGLSPGTYTYYAIATDSQLLTSTAVTATETIAKAASSTALVTSASPAIAAQSVTFTATVSNGTSTAATGAVTFMDGSNTLGSGTLNASGVATFSMASLSAGSHSITAVYGGDSNFIGSTSSVVTQTIAQTPMFASSQVGDGSVERSSLTSFQVVFSEPVNFTALSFTVEYESVADNQAYQAGTVTTQNFTSLSSTGDITFNSPDGGTTWVFSPKLNGAVDRTLGAGNSAGQGIFADGIYRLVLHGVAITDAATGAAQFNGGNDYTASFADGNGTFHSDFAALFGDLTGVGFVSNIDVARIRNAYLGNTSTYNAALDFRGTETQSSNLDVVQFKKRFLVSLLL